MLSKIRTDTKELRKITELKKQNFFLLSTHQSIKRTQICIYEEARQETFHIFTKKETYILRF